MSDIKNIRNKLDNILNEGLGEMADMVERDHEVQMARSDLYKTAKYAIKLHGMLKNVSEAEGLQGWVQSKITKAADYMGSVQHYMEYEMTPPDMQLALAQTESEMNEEKIKMVKGPDGKMVPSFAADGKGKNDLKKKVDIKEDDTTDIDDFGSDMKKHEVLTKIGKMLTMLEEQVYELQQHDQGDAYTSGSGDLTDQIVTMDKLMDNFEAVVSRAKKIVPVYENVEEDVIKEKDTINSIIAKLPRDNAEKGSDSSSKGKGNDSMQDIIDRLPKGNDEAVPDIMPGTDPKPMPKMKPTLKDPYGADRTISLDKKFSRNVARTNARNMKNVRKESIQSKFSDWSKK